MDFSQFPDLAGGPERLPPAEVRITELRANPWPDGQRVRVHVELTPFQERPNLELTIQTSQGAESASVSLIEVLTTRFVITMHLRRSDPGGEYSLSGRLYYPDLEAGDQSVHSFVVPPSSTEEQSPETREEFLPGGTGERRMPLLPSICHRAAC
jgi:hypothetical protein